MAKFRTRSFVVEAMQFDGDNHVELDIFTGGRFNYIEPEDRTDDPDCNAEFFHWHRWRLVYKGQWIVKGPGGELSLVDDMEFRTKYEPI